MSKYYVEVYKVNKVTGKGTVFVDANSPEEANEKARKLVEDGEVKMIKPDTDYIIFPISSDEKMPVEEIKTLFNKMKSSIEVNSS